MDYLLDCADGCSPTRAPGSLEMLAAHFAWALIDGARLCRERRRLAAPQARSQTQKIDKLAAGQLVETVEQHTERTETDSSTRAPHPEDLTTYTFVRLETLLHFKRSYELENPPI